MKTNLIIITVPTRTIRLVTTWATVMPDEESTVEMKKPVWLRGIVIGPLVALIAMAFLAREIRYNGPDLSSGKLIRNIILFPISAMFMLADDDSEYARYYTEPRFRKIKIGDTKERVLTILGDPITVNVYPGDKADARNTEMWKYERHGGYSNRAIYFNGNGLVIRVYHHSWND